MRGIALTAVLLAALAFPLCAQAAAGNGEKDEPVELTAIDLSIPTQPAAHLLGIDPSGVKKPSNLRELLVTAINSADRQGNLQQGFGAAITGWRLWSFRGTVKEYERDWIKLDTEFSVAAVKGATDVDPSAKLGIGVSMPIIDDTRPFRNLGEVTSFFTAVERCQSDDVTAVLKDERAVLRALEKDVEPYASPLDNLGNAYDVLTHITEKVDWLKDNPDRTKATPADIASLEIETAALWDRVGKLWIAERQKQLKQRTEDRWNARALSLAAGLAWVSPTGLTDDFRSDRYGLWLRGADPMGREGQFLYALSYRDRETVPDPNNEGQFLRQNAWFVGGRYLYGSATHGVSLEVSYSIENPEEGQSERVRTYLLGWEQRLTKDQWLQMSVGTEDDRSTGDQLLFGFSYNIGLGNKAQIARPGQ